MFVAFWLFVMMHLLDARDVLRAPGSTVVGVGTGALSILSDIQPESWILLPEGFRTLGVFCRRPDHNSSRTVVTPVAGLLSRPEP